MTPDAMDRFAAVILVKSGIELPEFAHYLETQPVKDQAATTPEKASREENKPRLVTQEVRDQKPTEKNWQIDTELSKPVEHTPFERTEKVVPSVISTTVRYDVLREHQEREAMQAITNELVVHELPPLPSIETAPKIAPVLSVRLEQPKPATTKQHETVVAQVSKWQDQQKELPKPELQTLPPITEAERNEPAGIQQETPTTLTDELPTTLPESQDYVPAVETSTAEQNATEHTTTTINTFAEALRTTFARPQETTLEGDSIPVDAEPFDQEVQPVAREVTEHLVALEPAEQELVAPVVQKITEAVLEIQTMQLIQATPGEFAMAEEELTALVVQLFEAIHLEYDEVKVTEFVQLLLKPEFAKQLTSERVIWREDVGTREIKRRFRQFAIFGVTLTHFGLSCQALGFAAMLRTNPNLHLQLAV